MGSRGNPLSLHISKQNHVVGKRIYLQPSNTKWVSRRQILCLFFWNGKDWHPWLCHSRISTPAQSSYSPFSSTNFCLAVLPLSIGFGAMTDLWTKQQFLCTVTPIVFSDVPATPDSEHFTSLCAGMVTLELGWSWSRRRKPSKMPCLLKHSRNLQCELIVYTIKLYYYNSFIGSV